MKYKASRDIPKFIRSLKTFSPSQISAKILTDRNKKITPESITMWLKRHPEINEKLRKEIIKSEVSNEEVQQSIFINGTFEALPSVAKWIKDMRRRKIVAYKSNVGTLKQLCKGYFPRSSFKTIPDWTLKHPDRLTQENVLDVIDYLEDHKVDTATYRLVARNFFMSSNKKFRDISGAKSSTFGKYADLFVEKATLTRMLSWIKSQNFEAFVCSSFMFKTGTRLTATLKAKIEEIRDVQGIHQINVYDKGRKTKHPNGKKWTKFLPDDLYANMMILIGDRTEGRVFQGMDKTILSKLNRQSIDMFCDSKTSKHISMPNHFWRHMFAQHMLRATGWKYGVVANLGGWSVKALEESYGKPPLAQIQEWGLEYIPQI